MIGIRPSTRRKIGGRKDISPAISKLEKACRGESLVTTWSVGVHSIRDKYADTWERRSGSRYPQRVRKKRGAIKTIRAPDSEDNGREYMDTLDYGDMWKMVLETPCVYDKEDVGVEFIESEGFIRVTAPGFSRDLPLLTPKGFKESVDWNYKNGVIEVNQRK